MTQRKPSVRIISFLLAIAMLFTLLPNGLKAYAADIHDFISYEITYFGLTPDDDGVVKNGTSFEVRLEGSISADYTDTVLPLEFTIDLETSEVKLSGSGTINYNGTRAGSFTVDADGTVHITIDDNAGGNSFINQGNRNFSLEFSAAVDAEETEDGSEKDTTVKVGEQEIDVTVQFPDSYLNGEKTAVGEAWYDPDTDMVYQTYIIRQTAVNGNVSEAYIYDYMGEWLSGPVDDVKITYDIYGKYDGPKESYEYAEQESDSEFYVYIPEIRKGETIEIEYTLAIDKKYFSFEDYDNRSLNQFGSDYVDQNGNDHDPTPDGWVYPNVERPGVTKGGEYTVNGDEVVWTIIVDAGIFETCDDFIADFGITVTDIPGDGLADEGEKIILPSYTNNGDGTYTFTYTTELTDEVISQLKDLSKTVTVHNDVLAGNDDFTFSGEADVTRDGIGILDKEATATGPDADGRFAWKSTLTIPVEGIEGLVFTDSTAGSKNGHKIIKDTMVIDGTPIAELEKAGKVTVTVSGRQLVVAFSDDYLAELQANNRRAHTIDGYQGNVYLADIVITYMTEPDNDADLDGSYTFTNTSDLEYTITDSGDKVTATDSDEYIQIIEAKKYFSKQGLEWSSLNSDWLIDLEVRLDELEVGDVFKIIDTPENMEIIEDTIIPYVHLNGWTTTEISEIYDDIDSFLTFRDNKNGTYTFTFTITQGLYDAVYGALESWVPASDVYFSIGYCTRITNPDEWDWDTEYTNTADGTFNGNPGEQTIATRHFSKNDNVSKRFIYSIDNDKFDFGVSNGKLNARFEVKINPNSLMLGNEDVIYLTDKMSEGLVMIPASTVITDAVTGKVLKNGDDYFIDFDEDKNEIYFTVPNGRSLLLTYMAEIAGDAPVIGEPDVGFAAGNTIELYVKDGASFASNTDASGNIFKSSGTLISEGYSITVSKVSEINGTKLFPEGANFEVVRVYYNELTEEFELATDNMQGENIVVTPIEGTNLTTITGLVPDAVYRLKETEVPDGFKLSDQVIYFMFPVDPGTVVPPGVVVFDNLEVLYFNNDPDFGGLKIFKTVDNENITDAELRNALTFTVQKEDGKYVDEEGKLHDEPVEIPFRSFKKQSDGSFVLTFTQLPAGTYTVTETNTEIDGYKLITDASVTEGTVEVVTGDISEISLRDSYEEVGNLTITKSIDGLNVTDEEKAGGLKFTVRNKDGKYLDIDGTLHDEIVEITLDKFTQRDGIYVLEFTDIPVGEYTVTETNTEIEGYKFISEESATSDSAEVKHKQTAEIGLSDSYEEVGNLKITKSIDGLNVTDEEKAGGLKFTVRNKDGKYLDVDGSLHDEIVEITLDKFTQKADGTYELIFTDIAVGEYTVTETNTEIDGYRFLREESVTSDSAEVKQKETAEIALSDSYEAIGNLKITKSIDGLNVTDEEKAGGLKFTVKNKDGKYLDIDGTLHDEIVEITLDKFTQKDDGTYELIFTDIAAGEYTVTETNTEIDGYRLVTDASVTGD
ncbi:MAG: hypothetical protein J1E39_05445, partial [Eubacterium sp.]|nr:hypothetical protein [Eubacterium sp.]